MSIHSLRANRNTTSVSALIGTQTSTSTSAENASTEARVGFSEDASFERGVAARGALIPPGDLPLDGTGDTVMGAMFDRIPVSYDTGATGMATGAATLEAAPGKLRSSQKSGVDGKMYTGSMGLQDSYDCFGYALGLNDTDRDVLLAIARNEGNIDAINTYDSAMLSFGFMQWTAKYELADLLHKMKEVDPQEFDKFFGEHGLDVKKVGRNWELTLDGKVLDSNDDKWDAFFGKPPKRKTIAKWEDIFFTSRNAESMHKAQLLMGKERINEIRETKTKTGHQIGDYIKSAHGLAHIVDYHVNRPAYAIESFHEALKSLGNPAPGAISEEQLIAAFTGRRIERNDGTHAADRVNQIDHKFGLHSAISNGHYNVRSGDSLTKIAKLLGSTVDALRAANPGMSERLSIGQQIKVPGAPGSSAVSQVEIVGNGQHIVKEGETLWGIAQAFGTSVSTLYDLNPDLNRSSTIHSGQALQIRPAANASSGPSTHTVARGETAWAIAKRYDVSVDDLLAANGMDRNSVLRLDQELQIPGRGGEVAVASVHVVSAGDTLYGISSRYGIDLAALLEANDISEDSPLLIGESLDLPNGKAKYHTVQRSESLYAIANHYGISVNDLLRANPELGTSTVIHAGQQLLIKGGSEKPSTISHASASSSINADTSAMTEAQRYDHYKALIKEHDGKFRTGAGDRNLISLRTETDTDTNGGNGRYDDITAMLWVDDKGNKRVREYKSNTEPSARYRGKYGEDANGDGKLDQGRMPAGYYEFKSEWHSKLGHVLRPTKSMQAERDTNQDGLFNDGAFASAGKSMLFHAGGRNATQSAGCQTMHPDVFKKFWSDLNASGKPGTVGYTLIQR